MVPVLIGFLCLVVLYFILYFIHNTEVGGLLITTLFMLILCYGLGAVILLIIKGI